MSTSVEKIYNLLEQLDELTDEQLAETLPIPAKASRMALMAASTRVPTDPAQLDDWALKGALWCLSMRSDDAEPYMLHSGVVRELEPMPPAAAAEPEPEGTAP